MLLIWHTVLRGKFYQLLKKDNTYNMEEDYDV